MKKLIAGLLLTLSVFVTGEFAAPPAKAFTMPQECVVIHWCGATQAACAWAIMIELYGYGEWPV